MQTKFRDNYRKLSSEQSNDDLSQSFILKQSSPDNRKHETSRSYYLRIIVLISNYIRKDSRRNSTNFKIGILTIFLVVSLLSLLNNLITQSTVIFVKISENLVSDVDVVITPYNRLLDQDNQFQKDRKQANNTFGQFKLIRNAAFDKICNSENEFIEGCSGRQVLPITISNQKQNKFKASMVMIDGQKEQSIGLGRNFQKYNYLQYGKTIVSNQILEVLGLQKDQKMKTQLQLLSNLIGNKVISIQIHKILSNKIIGNTTLKQFLEQRNISEHGLIDIIQKSINITVELNIQEGINSPNGKWAEVLGNVALIDQTYFMTETIQQFELKLLNQLQKNNIISQSDFDQVYQYLQQSNEEIKQQLLKHGYSMTFNMIAKNRELVYSDDDEVQQKQMVLLSDFIRSHSDEEYDQMYPIYLVFNQVKMLKTFLDVVLISASIVLIYLAILLIYSLMIQNQDEKTYEFGMLRALGLDLKLIIVILTFQSLMFSIPGLLLGLTFSYLLNGIIMNQIFRMTTFQLSYQIYWQSLLISLFLGIIIPLISNILPIQKALSRNIKDSLDLYRRITSTIQIQMIKLSSLGLDLSQSLLSLYLIIIGIMSYYLAPMAFLYQKIKLFIQLMNIVMVMMIFGFIYFFNLFQQYVQKVLIIVFTTINNVFNRDEKFMYSIISKNIKSHEKRNNKTSLLFTVTIAFMIFSGTGFRLLIKSINDSCKYNISSDLEIESKKEIEGLPEKNLTKYLQEMKQNNVVQQFTFSTKPMKQDLVFKANQLMIGNMGGGQTIKSNIIAISDNYMETLVAPDLYIPTQYLEQDIDFEYSELSTGVRNGFDALFKLQNNDTTKPFDPMNFTSNTQLVNRTFYEQKEINAIIPEGISKSLSIKVGDRFMLFYAGTNYIFRTVHVCSKVPGFVFSRFEWIQTKLTIIISKKDYLYIREHELQRYSDSDRKKTVEKLEFYYQDSFDYIPKEKLLVQYNKSSSHTDRKIMVNEIRNIINFDFFDLNFQELEVSLDGSKTASNMLNMFIYIVSSIAFVIGFFLLLITTRQNIRDNRQEIGVLLALGITQKQIKKVYLFENLAILFGSAMIGIFIGYLIAITLSLQFLMFVEMPFSFQSPNELIICTVLLNIVISVYVIHLGFQNLHRNSISSILKAVD